ncbi:MAG: DUF4340 domain-containing protein [Anaerolineae bacterium]|nr:DUF4340 domain-containing protein [Anaerolineae bacterium]
MRLNRNTLIALGGLLVIIIAAVLLLNRPAETPEDIDTDTTDGVFYEGITADTVTGITIVDSDGLVATLSRPDAETPWQIADTGEEADADRMATAVVGLINLNYTDSFTSENVTDFGFGEDAILATITFTADGTEHQLLVGRQNPSGNRYYVMQPDDDTIYLVSNANLDSLLGLASDQPVVVLPTATPEPQLNAPGVVFAGFSGTDIQRFEIADNANDQSLVFVRSEEDQTWSIEGDDRAVDQTNVEIMMSVYGFLEAVDATDAPDLAPLGLDEPAYTIVATDSTGKTFTVQVGDNDPTGTRTYVLIDDFERVAIVESDALSFLLDWLVNPPLAPEPTPTVEAEPSDSEQPSDEAATEESTEESLEEPTAEATSSDS